MLDRIKIATKDTFIYSLGNITTKIIGLVLLPLYTEKLSVSEYGVLGVVEISIQLLIAAFSLSLQQALSRWYWDEKYRDKQHSMFFTTLIATVVIVVFMFLIFLPFTGSLSVLLLDSAKYNYLFKLMLISASLQIISRLIFMLMRLQRKPLWYSLTNIFKLLVTLGLTIYFIVVLKRGVEGIIEAQIIGFVLLILANGNYIYRNIKPIFERSIFREMIQFSFPLVLSAVGGILLNVTDRYLLRYIGDMEDVGLYNLGFKLANVLKIFVINSVSSAIGPLKYKLMNQPNNKRFYSKIMTYTAYGFIVLLLVLTLFSKEAIRFLAANPDYWSAYQIVPFLTFAHLFDLLRRNVNFGLLVRKKTKIISAIMLIIAIINVVFNALFISSFGILGAAAATMLAQIVFFSLIFYFAQKHYPVPFEMKKIMIMIIIALGIVVVTFLLINPMDLFIRLIIKVILILLFPILLYFFNFYEKIELLRLHGAWRKWKNPKRWPDNIRNIKTK
jgi:O-antigen/teichoic acid export membrane protein